jgi:hypothetical protein
MKESIDQFHLQVEGEQEGKRISPWIKEGASYRRVEEDEEIISDGKQNVPCKLYTHVDG